MNGSVGSLEAAIPAHGVRHHAKFKGLLMGFQFHQFPGRKASLNELPSTLNSALSGPCLGWDGVVLGAMAAMQLRSIQVAQKSGYPDSRPKATLLWEFPKIRDP